ncbi:MAG: S41 family peptidase [Limisphaerales bacterium]
MTKRQWLAGLLAVGTTFAGVVCPLRAAEPPVPDFDEVRRIVREQLAGATDESVNRAAVEGFLQALGGRVALAAPEATTEAGPLIPRQQVFDGSIGYLRVARVAPGLADAVATAARELMATNTLGGLVLDLRFTAGADYAAAAATVDLFLAREVPLLNAGQGLVSSQTKTNALRLPVVALVNGQTSEGAEALAAVLRKTGAGLVLGSRTAGRAAVMREFPLSNGQTLRVAVAPILLGDAKPVPMTGLEPDIVVTVKPEDERAAYEDPFVVVAGAGSATNAVRVARRPRVSEADLVRERRGESPATRTKTEPETPVLADVALGRAIDLLKGLAVVRGGRF